jgi:tetratricopeptide (TPR) repeat protein
MQEKNKVAAQLCNYYPNAGTYCLDLRQYPRERTRWLEAALAAARSLMNRASEGGHLGNLGNAYAALGEPRRAIEFYEQALAIDREISDRRGEATDLWNMSLAQDKLGEREQAIANAEAALKIYEQITSLWFASNWMNGGEVKLKT